MDIWYMTIFRKSVTNIEVSLKSDINNWYITWRPTYIYDNMSPKSFYNENVSDKRYRENQNTHFMLSNFFRNSCRLWDTVQKYGTATEATYDNIVQRTHILCRITKATDTLWICNTYCFSTVSMITRTCLNVTFIRTLTVLLFSTPLKFSDKQATHLTVIPFILPTYGS
jgi:hypothetical protein